MVDIPVLRPGGPYRSREEQELTGVNGTVLARVSQAPPLLVGQVLRAMRQAADAPTERLDVLERAGLLFATATLSGESPADFARAHALATGVPVSVARAALAVMPHRLRRLRDVAAAQRPAGTSPNGAGNGARWVPRGRLLGVVAPSNHPMTHIGWLQAIAFGYRVAVRPGSRDPFTPRRLAMALLAAGLDDHSLTLLPGEHSTANAVLRGADLGLVYGDDAAVASYRGHTAFLVRGPGRTKALLHCARPDDETLGMLVSLIAADGGVKCTNISAVLVEGDHAAVAEALADRLQALPVRSVLDERAVLPTRPAATAEAIARHITASSAGTVEVTDAGRPPLAELTSGETVLRPRVFLADSAAHPALRLEAPFPCVWVAPWQRRDGISPLRDSLVVHVLGDGDDVVPELLAEPTVRTVVHGPQPDWWHDPVLPHDGYLSAFLMEARGYLPRQPAELT